MAIQTEESAANGTRVSKELDVTLSLSVHTHAHTHTRKARVHCNRFEC